MTGTDDFEALAIELRSDPDRDVTREGSELLVGGTSFARLSGEELLVRLPSTRADDLVERGVATAEQNSAGEGAAWVAVSDREDWSELAGEAHTLARGHVAGGES